MFGIDFTRHDVKEIWPDGSAHRRNPAKEALRWALAIFGAVAFAVLTVLFL
jgi:hypothetical protein